MPPSFCSLIPQVVILPIEHSPVLISVYVESQNVKHAPQYLVLSLSPCFESHVRSLLCYPEIAVRADLQQSDWKGTKCCCLMLWRETVLREQMWQHLVKQQHRAGGFVVVVFTPAAISVSKITPQFSSWDSQHLLRKLQFIACSFRPQLYKHPVWRHMWCIFQRTHMNKILIGAAWGHEPFAFSKYLPYFEDF